MIYQINGHSWAEVYFAGYGWVEFEPTAAFPTASPRSGFDPTAQRDDLPPEFDQVPAPIPEVDPQPAASSWRWLRFVIVGALALVLGGAWWWQRRSVPEDLEASYGRFRQQAQQLGTPSSPALTPFEFQEQFFSFLAPLQRIPRLQALVRSLRRPATRLTQAFVRHQYRAPQPEAETAVVQETREELHRPLRRLQIAYRLRVWLRRTPPAQPNSRGPVAQQDYRNPSSP